MNCWEPPAAVDVVHLNDKIRKYTSPASALPQVV